MSEKSAEILSDYRRVGKSLVAPLGDLPVRMVDWEGTYLPENLWLAHTIHRYGLGDSAKRQDLLCDIAEEINDDPKPFLGHISDFGTIPAEKRDDFVSRLADCPVVLVGADFRALLGLYPHGPAAWLAKGEVADPDKLLESLRKLIDHLRDSHGILASQCRMLGLHRILAKGRLHFAPGIPDEELTELLVQYPDIGEGGMRRVHEFARITMNALGGLDQQEPSWGEEFWATNLSLAGCK